MSITEQQLNLFMSLFKGREDVYARRWETTDKSGYSPAYDINWDQYSIHKALGGILKDYPHKSHSRLTEESFRAHLEGREIIGIYPLLENNTSWFVVVDFDENDWKSEIIKLFEECHRYHLPAYIERSRSGNGGHLWIFYEVPYPANKSRTIIKTLLNSAGINIKVSINSSFDRIFPNQDYHTGKKLGNLIALPLQKASLEKGNSGFIDLAKFELLPDQWDLLATIQRVTATALDDLYSQFNKIEASIPSNITLAHNDKGERLLVLLSNTVIIGRDNLPSALVIFLRNGLKATNPNYFIKKATGQGTYGIASSSTLVEEHVDRIVIPRGYIGALLRYCKTNNIQYQLKDLRKKLPIVDYKMSGELFNYQQPAVAITEKKEMGVIIAPPGTGKTVIALSIIAKKKQPTLIIVHRRQLLDQWVQRIQSFLGIPKYKIGTIVKGQIDIGEHLTVAMVQSLNNSDVLAKIERSFGLIVIDECHHTPSDTYRLILRQLHTYYLYGLTATPIRKNKDEKVIFALIGEVIHEVSLPKKGIDNKGLTLNIKDTDFHIPFSEINDNLETLSDILIHDTARNTFITDDIRREINYGRSILVLTERKAHIEILSQFLKDDCEIITLSGDDSDSSRKTKIKLIEEGYFQVIIATGQFIGEGTDIGVLDCLFLVYPSSFEGKLIQYIGRVVRSENSPVIYDYRDLTIPYLEKMFQKRNRYYNKLRDSGMIKIMEEYLLKFEGDRFYIDNQVNAYPICVLNLGTNIESFQKGIVWKIRVLKYNKEDNSVFAEILSYNATVLEDAPQLSFTLLPVEQIRFRTIDTGGLLKSVVLKKTQVDVSISPQWWVFDKIVKIPFKKVIFGNGYVTTLFYVSPIKKEISIEIPNVDIRPEFEAVKEYFPKVLKTKSITVDIKIKHDKQKVISYEATSEEVNAINAHIIDSVRFEFVRLNFKKLISDDDKSILTYDDLKQSNQSVGALLENEMALLKEVSKMESAKHYLQIKYLAPKHDTTVLKLRFILQPFSFIFLIAGENKYHLIWETLDTEEATYLWHIPKNKESLRIAIKEIEISLNEMKETGRSSYIKNAPDYFSRIIHDYSDKNKGFIQWKGILEERLI